MIQRRGNFGEPRENFNRDWSDYKKGFGEPDQEFWIGNENLFMMTSNDDYALRIELEDFEGNRRSVRRFVWKLCAVDAWQHSRPHTSTFHSFFMSLKCNKHRYAQYSSFKIHSEAQYYRLEIDGYEGNAGDALSDLDYGSNNIPFSTYNRDNDRSSLNCASMLKVCWLFLCIILCMKSRLTLIGFIRISEWKKCLYLFQFQWS